MLKIRGFNDVTYGDKSTKQCPKTNGKGHCQCRAPYDNEPTTIETCPFFKGLTSFGFVEGQEGNCTIECTWDEHDTTAENSKFHNFLDDFYGRIKKQRADLILDFQGLISASKSIEPTKQEGSFRNVEVLVKIDDGQLCYTLSFEASKVDVTTELSKYNEIEKLVKLSLDKKIIKS